MMGSNILRPPAKIMRQFKGEIFKITSRKLSLLQQKAYVNGEWIGAINGKTFDVLNPATEKVIGNVPDMTETEVDVALSAAHDAFSSWGKTTAKERSHLLRKWFNLMQDNVEELAQLVTFEAGKPIPEAKGEILYGASFVEWFSEEARRAYGDVLCSPVKNKEMLHIKQPIGVVSLITPWNFPVAMITRKAGAALAAGCTCVVKPAEDTPFSALALAKLAEEAGLPKGVLNIVTSDRKNAASVGKLMCQSPKVSGISFTGSTAVGKLLFEQCASSVKRIGLELGGNAPFIVFNSADIDKAVEGAVISKFRNCGQTCVSANRFLIQEEVFDSFVGKFTTYIQSKIKLGDGSQPDVNQGPLINDAQCTKVEGIVNDAICKGAKVHVGGARAPEIGKRFFQPTLVSNVTPDMQCYNMEIFGPIAVCIKFKEESEALEIANNSNRGLAGYFYSNDVSQTWRVAKQLEVGMVGINEGLISSAEAAFGGIKESGIGREGSHYGLDEYTYIKYICFGNLN